MRNRRGLRDGSGPRRDCPRKDGTGSGNVAGNGPRRDGSGAGRTGKGRNRR